MQVKRRDLSWLLPVRVPDAPYSDARSASTCSPFGGQHRELGLTEVTGGLYKPGLSAVFQACLS